MLLGSGLIVAFTAALHTFAGTAEIQEQLLLSTALLTPTYGNAVTKSA